MLTIKVGRFSKQVPVMLQKIVVGIFICHTVDRIPQYQPMVDVVNFAPCFVSYFSLMMFAVCKRERVSQKVP